MIHIWSNRFGVPYHSFTVSTMPGQIVIQLETAVWFMLYAASWYLHANLLCRQLISFRVWILLKSQSTVIKINSGHYCFLNLNKGMLPQLGFNIEAKQHSPRIKYSFFERSVCTILWRSFDCHWNLPMLWEGTDLTECQGWVMGTSLGKARKWDPKLEGALGFKGNLEAVPGVLGSRQNKSWGKLIVHGWNIYLVCRRT